MRLLLALAVVTLLATASASRVLVLIDNFAVKETHSIVLGQLQERGHHLVVRTSDDSNLSLFKHGERVYDHLLVLAPSTEEFGGSVSPKEIAKFVDEGGNLLVAGSSNLGEAIREIAVEHGFEFDLAETNLIDHQNFDAVLDNGYHTTVVANKKNLIDSKLIVGDVEGSILFKGVAIVADKTNRLRLDVLRASSTAYSFNPTKPIDEYPAAVGKQALMIGALQARNNARVVFCGSLDLFSDAFINAQVHKSGFSEKPAASGNLALVSSLTKWVLKEIGVLRVKGVSHQKVGESYQPTEYTITEDVKYQIEIEELADGKWMPFKGADVQFEFIRIDPFVRRILNNKNGVLSTIFKLPDVYGVFKFSVDYRRVGYTHLLDVQQISVRPLWHTQYERFLLSAYPYYSSSFSMMFGVVLFSVVFLHFKEPHGIKESKKSK